MVNIIVDKPFANIWVCMNCFVSTDVLMFKFEVYNFMLCRRCGGLLGNMVYDVL